MENFNILVNNFIEMVIFILEELKINKCMVMEF